LKRESIDKLWDIHSHIFPKKYISKLFAGIPEIGITQPDKYGRNILFDKKTGETLTYFINDTPHVSVEKHLKDMDEFGIERQFLSVSPPHLDKINDEKRAIEIGRAINDGLVETIENESGKLHAMGVIPMINPIAAVDEIKRIAKELKFKGVQLPSNSYKAYYDRGFDDVFRTISELGLLIFIHPTEPVIWDRLGEDYNLTLVYGWPFDTTISVARLVFSGITQRLTGLKIVISHGGGMIPFMAGRVRMLGKDMRGKGIPLQVEDPVSEFKKLYYDTAFFYPPSLKLLLEFVGEDHIIMGTDYPFCREEGRLCLRETLQMLRSTLSEKQIEKIGKENLRKLVED
jgi:Predicted metal-dependent hydrolase of the TIM-barrel fold